MGFSESFSSFSYNNFLGLGRAVLRIAPGIAIKLESAGKRIHPEVFASTIGAITILTAIITVPVTVLLFILTGSLLTLSLLSIPVIALLIGMATPYVWASSAASLLESEVPYAASYLAVMSTGGIPPYKSLIRLANSQLMPNIAKAAKLAELNVRVGGLDPVTAVERMAKGIPSKEYKDLMLGYASTLRSGGDVVHYLIRKTEQIFSSRMGKMRIVGERMGMLMEGFAAITLMMSLVLFTIYIVSRALPSEYLVMPSEQFALLAYVILPGLSVAFLYIADISQPKYPMSDPRPMRTFFLTLPFAIIFGVLFVFPFFITEVQVIPPFNATAEIIKQIRAATGLEAGYESSIALTLMFIIMFTPGAIAYQKYGAENFSVMHGLTLFLRDLTEARKTGLSPERCIIDLSRNSYGAFSKHLKIIARQIGWGTPLRKIYDDFAKRTYGWLEKAGVFVLVDAIDVGGGAPETFEVLASFSEDLEEIERQKRATLKPLMLIPYITAIMLIIVVVILVAFMKNLLTLARLSISTAEFIHFFLPPVIIIAIISGLVAGKISSSMIAGGFKHAVIMAVLGMISIYASGTLAVNFFQLPT
ncbi:MAG: type II secretion system F family protein [Candidatus Caldarchaeum sp.]|nr:type II secretion system F family protein [Candidatus Caldarchaeum sp.]